MTESTKGKPRGRGAAGRIDQQNELIQSLSKRGDRWLIRATAAEAAIADWVEADGGSISDRQKARERLHAFHESLGRVTDASD